MSNDTVFIITRCVKQPEHNNLYKECCKCIRAFYTNPIYIIDDNSNTGVLEECAFENTTVIQSEFPGAGEFLPYYYFYTRKLGTRAVILQDSMFIQSKLDFNNVNDYKFLWYFNKNEIQETIHYIGPLFKQTGHFNELFEYFMEEEWIGCFGTCMVITYNFLEKLQRNWSIFNIMNHIHIRNDRFALERYIAIACIKEKRYDINTISFLGRIHDIEIYTEKIYDWGQYTYNDYKQTPYISPIVKVWNKR